MADPAALQRIVDGLERGRRLAVAAAKERGEVTRAAVLQGAKDDQARGRPARGRAARIAAKLHGLVSRRQVARILRAPTARPVRGVHARRTSNASATPHERRARLEIQRGFCQEPPSEQERIRASSITALGRAHDRRDLADRAITFGTPVEHFERELLKARAEPVRALGAIGTTQREIGQWSLLRWLLNPDAGDSLEIDAAAL